MFGAVAAGAAAGGYDSIVDASRAMARLARRRLPADRRRTTPSTTSSTASTSDCTTCFGRGGDDVMRNLKSIQLRVCEAERPT